MTDGRRPVCAAGLDSFIATFEGLSDSALANLKVYLEDTWSSAKGENTQLVRYLYGVEMGQRLVSRMITSGHSIGDSVWGNGDGEIDFTHFTPSESPEVAGLIIALKSAVKSGSAP